MGLRELRYVPYLIGVNVRSSMALRGAFILNAVFMGINNLIFFVIWLVLFARVPVIEGWRLREVALLYGIAATSFGAAVALFGGSRHLARMIADGELDAFLTQPRSVLLQILCSSSDRSGWGDVLSGFLFLACSGYLTAGRLPFLALALVCSMTVWLATGVILHSLTFWANSLQALARQAVEFLIAFSLYPEAIFSGLVKFVLFTMIPAGFVSFLPVQVVRAPGLREAVLLTAGAALYSSLALIVFTAGLRRYESGSTISVRR